MEGNLGLSRSPTVRMAQDPAFAVKRIPRERSREHGKRKWDRRETSRRGKQRVRVGERERGSPHLAKGEAREMREEELSWMWRRGPRNEEQRRRGLT
mgnify:CR=1 FL=1